jgi:hypothetical protein
MAFEITFVLIDGFKRTTRKTFGNNRTLIADAVSDTSAMITLLESVSGSAVSRTYISQVTNYPAAAGDTGANNDAGATLHVVLDNGNIAGLKVPAFITAKCLPDGGVDLSDADVLALVAAFATAEHWRISEGNYVQSLRSGELDK